MVQEDVGLERSHEDEGGGARIADAHSAGLGGAAEVVGDDGQPAARRRVFLADVERDDERRARFLMRVDREVDADGFLNEGDELLGNVAKDGAGIGVIRHGDEVGHELRDLHPPAVHGGHEQLLFGAAVPQQRRRRDAELARNVGQRGGLEALLAEDPSSGLEQTFRRDRRRASHR